MACSRAGDAVAKFGNGRELTGDQMAKLAMGAARE
jgi:hypothetical protein